MNMMQNARQNNFENCIPIPGHWIWIRKNWTWICVLHQSSRFCSLCGHRHDIRHCCGKLRWHMGNSEKQPSIILPPPLPIARLYHVGRPNSGDEFGNSRSARGGRRNASDTFKNKGMPGPNRRRKYLAVRSRWGKSRVICSTPPPPSIFS